MGCTRISPGYVGIITKNVGTNRGVQDFPAQTGWVFYNPLTESVLEYPTFVKTSVWTANTAEGKPVNEEITFTCKEALQIAADISLAYQLNPEKVPNFYVQFRSDDLDNFTYGFLRNLAREKFDDIGGHYSVETIMGDNGPYLAEVRKALQHDLDPIGVELRQFGFIGAPRPPRAVIDSINAKVQATQIALQKQNELVQSQADAAKEVAKAEGDAKATLTRAEAQSQANQKLANSISPTLVEYMKVQKWNGQLPQVTGAQSGIVLKNLEK